GIDRHFNSITAPLVTSLETSAEELRRQLANLLFTSTLNLDCTDPRIPAVRSAFQQYDQASANVARYVERNSYDRERFLVIRDRPGAEAARGRGALAAAARSPGCVALAEGGAEGLARRAAPPSR